MATEFSQLFGCKNFGYKTLNVKFWKQNGLINLVRHDPKEHQDADERCSKTIRKGEISFTEFN